MTLLQEHVTTGRLIILPIAILGPAIVIVSTGILQRYPQDMSIRSVVAVLAAVIYLAAILPQILIFRLITGIAHHVVDDNGLFSIIVTEVLVSLGLLFYRLRK